MKCYLPRIQFSAITQLPEFLIRLIHISLIHRTQFVHQLNGFNNVCLTYFTVFGAISCYA